MRDLHGETTQAVVLPSQAVIANGNGAAIDLRGYQGIVKVLLNCGAATAGTNPTMDVKLQDSPDTTSGNFADVTGLAYTQVTTVASLQALGVDTRSVRRYIRAVVTIGGTSNPSFPVSVSLVAEPQYKS
jgi:hypothetical protein